MPPTIQSPTPPRSFYWLGLATTGFGHCQRTARSRGASELAIQRQHLVLNNQCKRKRLIHSFSLSLAFSLSFGQKAATRTARS